MAPQPALRLIFAYDGDQVTLVSQQRVTMTLPPADELDLSIRRQGFWTELRRADGEVLERRVVHDPIRRDAEVFSDAREKNITRVPIERPQGAFMIVVPDDPEADHVVLIAAGPEPGAGEVETRVADRREVARVNLSPRFGEEGYDT